MIDALSVVHAGRGAEQTGPGSGNIWSHKYNITSRINLTSKTYALTYLTVPEDAKLGVIAHEMGHLLFTWPDLYDSQPRGTRVTEGLGDWCLMASGSWNNNGLTPAYPSAWCRYVQGWTETNFIEEMQKVTVRNIEENREIYRLWTKGQLGTEYFLMENRQKVGFDSHLPGDGIMIYHIDETMPNNWDEDHLAVGVMQADGRKDLQEGGFFRNQGDASDPYPGTTKNYRFGGNVKPGSLSYAGKKTGVNVRLLQKASSKAMQVLVRVDVGT
jgi:immune inhibitor A